MYLREIISPPPLSSHACTQGRACGSCITSSFKNIENPGNVDPNNIEEYVDKEALKSCCGECTQCSELLVL